MPSLTMQRAKDPETGNVSMFTNDHIESFSWSDVSVQVTDRSTKQPRVILESNSGFVKAGQVIALMGPSGSGKTTLLNVLANRSQTAWQGQIRVNGNTISRDQFRQISGYVEQDDALVGSLTVQETIDFCSQLAQSGLSRKSRHEIVQSLLHSFGLQEQANTIIGTPIHKGISGGQKRRTSVASQLVTSPNILFLDEPTSGLDSAASFEVMSYISSVAKKHNLIVIASIHQPSTTTFELFDSLLLMSLGQTCYFGPISRVQSYFEPVAPMPLRVNPAEFLLDLVNADFKSGRDMVLLAATSRPDTKSVAEHWKNSPERQQLLVETQSSPSDAKHSLVKSQKQGGSWSVMLVLLHRNFIKSYRDFLTYGTRLAMYTGLAILMGTVWLRLSYSQSSIQPFINAIFFSGAFMSFMAVAYVPSIIEDLLIFQKDHGNGLYGPFAFIVANFLIGIPWLFIITVVFSVITYWLSNFRASADGFWLWVLWLYLDLLAAEGLVVLLSAIFPVFVISLAATAFANGLWMSVGGFLVPLDTLNVFWKYVFHYIDYQSYVFQAMMVNQFRSTIYDCDKVGSGYYCMYSSDLQSQGKIRGTAVLQAYNYPDGTDNLWKWFGIMLAIIVVYRILAYVTLALKAWRK